MSLQMVSDNSNTALIATGFSLFNFHGEIFLFGQKGWPRRSCSTGVFLLQLKGHVLKLKAVSFSPDSCYLPPLRCPAITHHSDPSDSSSLLYFIHGGRDPNNDLSSVLYCMMVHSSTGNKRTSLRCIERKLGGDVPQGRYGHTINVIQNNGLTLGVLFGGRSYRPPGQRTTENWNSVVDCAPRVFLIDINTGHCTSHLTPEIEDGFSFHVSMARMDTVYILGGHSIGSNHRPARLLSLKVDLLATSPSVTCTILNCGIAVSSAIVAQASKDEFIIVGGYESESQKRMLCNTIILDSNNIQILEREPPDWTSDIKASKTWFGNNMGNGAVLIGIPGDSKRDTAEANFFYIANFGQLEEESQVSCSQESFTDPEECSTFEDSEEFHFEVGADGSDDAENLDNGDEEGYWIKCSPNCNMNVNIWAPHYSTELHKPAMIFCSSAREDGHWVHAQCMDLAESQLIQFSQENTKYFCKEHLRIDRGIQTPQKKRQIKRTPIKLPRKKSPATMKRTPMTKSFLKRLFD
ncbi:V(D)J recombination-activating protein 2 [Scyliorhinus canicula]|uniref:V(D)J recombination-activating protein 2 n=1 Tax=Scyliorhinus canicula TaxID=7830 RepID=UPI0018F56243|nr:V(D)J recombination-activating protein 2 [Scyliorhinus canicula]XP_038664187.1 V(D)J recombination-activating protein 2 [Scyliorhinus canicula]XP_038664188.1 V(D)J recombination-activating protein 2 [Scyliorhinus canicula]XP_038664189.1 V(D)J recombination-activating protein 2 [Scyliorhinus canicula]